MSTTLHTLGALSFLATIAFTVYAARDGNGAGQSPRSSIIETWLNILIGFTINYLANWLILPLVHVRMSSMDNFMMGWIYTAISMVRQYSIRRWFNASLHKAAAALDKKL